MQRLCSKLGRPLISSSRRFLAPLPHKLSVASPVKGTIPHPAPNGPQLLSLGFHLPFSVGFPVMQARHFAAKAKKRSRAPATPVTSKLKKYKLKAYSSFKFRFRTMNDGKIRRWRAGKRHNAHLKSKESKRRLRRPEIVHLAYAKVIKKLNFCG